MKSTCCSSWICKSASRLALAGLFLVFTGLLGAAQTFTTLHQFTDKSDGGLPSDLILDGNGNIYGGTWQGGNMNCSSGQGCGTIFKIDASNEFSVIYAFDGSPDAAFAGGPLVLDSAGNLYGTTGFGGTANLGTVFKVDADGNDVVLYNFKGGTDGQNGSSGLVRDGAGNLYGTTPNGGDLACYIQRQLQCGIVFKVSKAGKETVLHRFNGHDGAFPYAGLIRDGQGNLYGTTGGGINFAGSVFRIDKTGEFTVLHRFSAAGDGYEPHGRLLRDAGGNLYGTTDSGGKNNFGTVYKIESGGKETVLYSFKGGPDGGEPYGNLVRDKADNLYGTTMLGGDLACNHGSGCGTIFELDKTGHEMVLHNFEGTPGKFPQAGLVIDSAGNLYGTTKGDALTNFGSVFKLIP